MEARSFNCCCSGKAISIRYSECVSVALVIRHAKHMCRIILPSVACPAVPYFSTLSHERHDFRVGVGGWNLLNMNCVFFIFHTTFVWDISHPKKNWASFYRKRTEVFIQSTTYCCQIVMEHEFSRQIFGKRWSVGFHENPSSGRRVVPWGRAGRHTDRQTWRN